MNGVQQVCFTSTLWPRPHVPNASVHTTPQPRIGRTEARAPSASSASIGIGGSGNHGSGVAAAVGSSGDLSVLGLGLNPRQLASHLDEFVVGQEKAKKVLAVAVYNHYTRLRHIQATTQQSNDERDAAPLPPTDDPYSSTFHQRPHVARIQPRERERDRDKERDKGKVKDSGEQGGTRLDTSSETSTNVRKATPDHPSRSILSSSTVPASSSELDDREGTSSRTSSTSSSTSFSFERSYSPRLSSTKRRNPPSTSSAQTPASTLDPTLQTSVSTSTEQDPTLYDSAPSPTLHNHSIRGSNSSTTSSSRVHSDSSHHDVNALLTDFVGQQAGQPLQPIASTSSSSSRKIDPEALVYEKSNVLLLGPTGSGKSLLARTLASCLSVPFVALEATGMTMAGYVGEDVESCIHRLLVAADWDVERASHGIVFIDEIDKLSRSSSASYSKDVSGEGVQQALLKILEGTVVSVPDREDAGAAKRGKSPAREAHMVDTTNILFVLSGAFVGLEKMITNRLEKSSIGFGAKIASKNQKEEGEAVAGPDATPTLELVEPQDLVHFGFIPEFIGRLPVIGTLKALSEADLLRVLTEPRNALVKQYEALFAASNVECRFTTLALKEVASLAVGKGTGARGLRRILEKVLLDAMFAAPQSSIRYVLIDRDVVRGKKPAVFYSRGQQSLFLSAFNAEEGEEDGTASEEVDVVFEKRRALI